MSLPLPAWAQQLGSSGAVSIADVAERVTPSVVNLSATKIRSERSLPGLSGLFADPFFRHFFGDSFFRFGPGRFS